MKLPAVKISFFKPKILFLLKGLIIIGVIGGIGIGGIAWRLSHGPLSVNFLTESLNHAHQGKYEFSCEDVKLVWHGWRQPLALQINGLAAGTCGKGVLLKAPSATLDFKVLSLLKGKILPTSLYLSNPELQFRTAVATDPVVPADLSTDNSSKEALETLIQQSINDIVALLHGGGLRKLRQLQITGGSIIFEDTIQGWSLSGITMFLARDNIGITGTLAVDVEKNTQKMLLKNVIDYRLKDSHLKVQSTIGSFNPGLWVAADSIVSLQAPLEGKIDLTLDLKSAEILEFLSFDLTSKEGALLLPLLYPIPLMIKNSRLKGHFSKGDLILEEAVLTLNDTVLQGKGQMQGINPFSLLTHKIGSSESPLAFSLDLSLEHVFLDQLPVLWPASLAPMVRQWVTRNIAKGFIPKAVLTLAGVKSPRLEGVKSPRLEGVKSPRLEDVKSPRSTAPVLDPSTAEKIETSLPSPGTSEAEALPLIPEWKITKLEGSIDFKDASLDYISKMPLLENVEGTALFNQSFFDISLKNGVFKSLKVPEASVLLTGLDQKDQTADIKIRVQGLAKDALELADHDPLNYLKKYGAEFQKVSGNADIFLHLQFPLECSLTPQKVTANIVGDVTEFAADLPTKSRLYSLTEGKLNLQINDKKILLKGDVHINHIPAKLEWCQEFNKPWSVKTQLHMIPDHTKNLGYDFTPYIQGPFDVFFEYQENPTGLSPVKIDVSLTPVGITLPSLGWIKAPGTEATLSLSATLNGETIDTVKSLTLTGKDINVVAQGHLKEGVFEELEISHCRVGFHDFSLSLKTVAALSGTHKGTQKNIILKGQCLNIEPFIQGKSSDEDPFKDYGPMEVLFTLNQLRVSQDKYINKVKGRALRHQHFWNSFSLDGMLFSGKKTIKETPVSVRLVPRHRQETLKIMTDNAGALFSIFGISDNIKNGKLVIEGQRPLPLGTTSRAGHALEGKLLVQDFSLLNSGFFSRLFSVALVVGIIDLVRGEGVSFSKGKIRFIQKDDILTLKRGYAVGMSLGFTLQGVINNKTNALNLRGTLIPAYFINSILSNIPLIGPLLSGGSKGMFATSFTVKGTKEDPKISSNPLSTFAPGFIREMFSDNDEEEEKETSEIKENKHQPHHG